MKGIKFFAIFLTMTMAIGTLKAQSLHIDTQDIVLETVLQESGDIQGFMLYVRQKPGINSVLLTETTRSPDGMATNYAYRALEWNETNGDERRILNGQLLVSEYAKFSIIDSTPEVHPTLGQAFCLYIPAEIQYGYPWTRHEITQVGVGTFINIRTFSALYGDYSKGYEDNPFMFDLGHTDVITSAPTMLSDTYNPEAASAFNLLTKEVGGTLTFSKGPASIINDILSILQELDPTKTTDIIFTVDATGSMKDDVAQLRKDLIPRLQGLFSQFTAPVRLGLLLYRDYVDGYRYREIPVRVYPFASTLEDLKTNLFDFFIKGNEGGDPPEAVYEALQGSMEFYDWAEDAQRRIILIGDAEPHLNPRGPERYTRDLVITTAHEKNIIINAIITPDGKTAADRK